MTRDGDGRALEISKDKSIGELGRITEKSFGDIKAEMLSMQAGLTPSFGKSAPSLSVNPTSSLQSGKFTCYFGSLLSSCMGYI